MSDQPEVRLSPDGDRLALRKPDSTLWRSTSGAPLQSRVVEQWTVLVAEDRLAELDRRVLEAWAERARTKELAEQGQISGIEEGATLGYAMGLSVAAAALGRPAEAWASPERHEAVRAWARDRQTLRDRLAGLAARWDDDDWTLAGPVAAAEIRELLKEAGQ